MSWIIYRLLRFYLLLSYNMLYLVRKMPPLRRRNTSGLAGGAGLIRYFDVDEGGPKLDPKLIVGFTAAFIILEVLSKILF